MDKKKGCSDFLNINFAEEGREKVELSCNMLNEKTTKAVLFTKTAIKHCTPGGRAEKEIGFLQNEIQNGFTATVNEAGCRFDYFPENPKEYDAILNPETPKNVSKAALDARGVDLKSYQQDTNRTNFLHNNRTF